MRRVCYLVTLVLQLVDGGQGAAGGFEVHEAVTLAPICSLVQDSLGGTYRTKPSKQLIVTFIIYFFCFALPGGGG